MFVAKESARLIEKLLRLESQSCETLTDTLVMAEIKTSSGLTVGARLMPCMVSADWNGRRAKVEYAGEFYMPEGQFSCTFLLPAAHVIANCLRDEKLVEVVQ
jgi:hypothetical protein